MALPAFAVPMLTTGGLLASQAPLSEKYLRPQFTVVCVAMTTLVIATDSSDHFDFAPQPPLQAESLSSSFIEPDLSWTMRTSGGSGMIGVFETPQVMPPLPVSEMSPPPPEERPIPPPPPAPLVTPPPLAATPVPVPVGTSPEPGAPGLKPQPTRPEIRRNLTSCPCNRRIGDLRREGGGCPDGWCKSLRALVKKNLRK